MDCRKTTRGSLECWIAPELEEHSTNLVRENRTDAEMLSPHAPEEAGVLDDARSMVALACLGAATGMTGDIVIL